MPRHSWRHPPDPSLSSRMDVSEGAGGHTGDDLEQIFAIARRAESLGFDPRRVLAALGVDPLTFAMRTGAAADADGRRDGSRPGTSGHSHPKAG